MEQVVNEIVTPQLILLESEQFERIVELLEKLIEYSKYNANILLAILAFVALACGISLANIFSRYMRG